MTNAIEQAKRTLFDRLKYMKQFALHNSYGTERCTDLELAIEAYLEITRQDHEALHETARKRFEDLQVAEAANQELVERLSLMTTDRDSLRNRMQAYEARDESVSTSGQTSGDSASCESTESNADVILAAVHECRRQIEKWGSKEIKAKKAIRKVAWLLNGDPKVESAIRGMNGEYKIIFHARFDDGVVTSESWHKAEPVKCQHSFFAIGQDQMKCTFCGVGK